MMPYKVTITKIDQRKVTRRGDYVKVADSGNVRDGGAQYDYAPSYEAIAEDSKVIYEQTVDELDVWHVAKAVNSQD